jgi:hypothetical protein
VSTILQRLSAFILTSTPQLLERMSRSIFRRELNIRQDAEMTGAPSWVHPALAQSNGLRADLGPAALSDLRKRPSDQA